jgi:hypothetical protein
LQAFVVLGHRDRSDVLLAASACNERGALLDRAPLFDLAKAPTCACRKTCIAVVRAGLIVEEINLPVNRAIP